MMARRFLLTCLSLRRIILCTFHRHTSINTMAVLTGVGMSWPSKTSITDYLALGGESGDFFNNFDNSLENKGSPGSSTDIGPGWAYAAATPLRLFKGYVAQGGIQVPAVVKLPGNMSSAWQDYADSNGVIQPDAPIAYSKPVIGRKY
jgi:hypothetical protein